METAPPSFLSQNLCVLVHSQVLFSKFMCPLHQLSLHATGTNVFYTNLNDIFHQRQTNSYIHSALFSVTTVKYYSTYSYSTVRRRTGQPLLSDTVRIRRLKLFGHVARADKSQDHSRALQACISPACPKKLEAASRSSKTYLAKDGGRRSAPI